MIETIQHFQFDDRAVRCLSRDDQPWFVAADVCGVLGIAETHRALAGLDEDEKGRHNMTTLGGLQNVSIINESGLYSLILRSRKPQAKRFRKWVTGEVLPAIRRTGRYEVAPAASEYKIPATFAEALRLAAEQAEMIEAQRRELTEAAPKLEVYDKVMDAEGLFGFRQVAAMLADKKLGPVNLVRRLLADKILFRNSRGELMAYRQHIEAGRFKCVETPYEHPDTGETRVSCNLKVTTKGVDFIARHFGTVALAAEEVAA